jgi:hypothetical protein
MRILVSGSTRTVGRVALEYPERLGILLTPGNRNGIGAVLATGLPWAADNGAYSGFDPDSFRAYLRRIGGRARCLFVVCPDKVADAQGTLELFEEWSAEVAEAGPVAFVGQDGQENLDVPWDRFSAFFIGGSTEWKLSRTAADLVAEAKLRGKHVHMGRVNTLRRMRVAHDLGCDSLDGSCFSRWAATYLLWAIRHQIGMERQPSLYT